MSAIYDAISKHQKMNSQIKGKATQMIEIFKLTAM